MEERKGFGSNFGFLMAAVGSAVGLGNIWGFPNKMGACGGFTFLLIYLLLAACCGFVVMVGELALGRKTGHGAVGAYKALSKKFKWLGWLGILSAFLILFFYCALGGYCIKYVVLNVGNLFGAGFGSGGMSGADVFGEFMGNQLESVIYGLIFVLLTMLIVMGGVGGGIEKVCSVGMPALFIILLICIIRACTLGGSEFEVAVLQADGSTVVQTIQSSSLDGLKYMFQPGYVTGTGYYEPAKALVDGAMVAAIDGVPVVKHITEVPNFFSVLSTAGGQMFFSLSLGMGAMITYGSYLHKKENIEKNALLIVIMDTMVALMAGLCVMPGRFALDASGAIGGPKLLFITMQNVFDKMPLGALFGILFYLLVVFAAISSSISLLEVIVAHFCDKARIAGKGDKRKAYSLIAAVAVGLGCTLVCLDCLGGAGIAPADLLKIEPSGWSDCWLDFFDSLSEGIMMPLGALLMCLCIGYEIGPKVVDDEACLEGQSFKSKGFFNICVKFITPIAMLLVLYGQIEAFFF
ncbi:MAG: sodium-dependent transporter [Clostridiales bacterium]|nr:sodium-dependent transporter [Clostridiales bacterium]